MGCGNSPAYRQVPRTTVSSGFRLPLSVSNFVPGVFFRYKRQPSKNFLHLKHIPAAHIVLTANAQGISVLVHKVAVEEQQRLSQRHVQDLRLFCGGTQFQSFCGWCPQPAGHALPQSRQRPRCRSSPPPSGICTRHKGETDFPER